MPSIIIQNIDSEQGEVLAQSLLAAHLTSICGLTTKTNHADLSFLREKWTTKEGIKLMEVRFVAHDDLQALKQAFDGASTIFIIPDYNHHLQEHSSSSPASVWKQPKEWVSAFRVAAEGTGTIAVTAGIQGLTKMYLPMVPASANVGGNMLEMMQKWTMAEIWYHLRAHYPHLAAKTETLSLVTEEETLQNREETPDLGAMSQIEADEQEDEEEEEGDSMPHREQVEEGIIVHGVGMRTIHFDTGVEAFEDDLRKTAEEMMRKGFVNPLLTNTGGVQSVNGRDKNDWINYVVT